jgi:hypothetical protein
MDAFLQQIIRWVHERQGKPCLQGGEFVSVVKREGQPMTGWMQNEKVKTGHFFLRDAQMERRKKTNANARASSRSLASIRVE